MADKENVLMISNPTEGVQRVIKIYNVTIIVHEHWLGDEHFPPKSVTNLMYTYFRPCSHVSGFICIHVHVVAQNCVG